MSKASMQLTLWISLLVVASWMSAWLARWGYEWTAAMTGLSLGALAVGQIRRHLLTTRRQFERLLDAVSADDLSLRFHVDQSRPASGSAHAQWMSKLHTSMQSFLAHRAKEAQELARYRSIVEAVPVALFDVVDSDQIVLLNRAARTMFRGSSLTHVKTAPAALQAAIDGLEDHERRMVHLPQLLTPTRFVLEMIRSFHAKAHHRIFAAKDVTQEIQSTESATWSKVAQVLAHEINNSLTPVTSLAESMSSDFQELCEGLPELDEQGRELEQDLRDGLATLTRRSAALMRFVDDYRKISQLPHPVPTWFEVSDLLDSVRTLLLPQLQAEETRLVTQLESPALRLRADRGQVEQCLINLVKNASAACAQGSVREVTLRAALDDLGHLQLSVLDTGPGLAAEDLERIFVPFFSTRAQGTGIGLSVVRQIMQAHGGRVQALSRTETQGACFQLTFVR